MTEANFKKIMDSLDLIHINHKEPIKLMEQAIYPDFDNKAYQEYLDRQMLKLDVITHRNEIQEALMRYLAGIFPDGVVQIDGSKDKTQLCYVYRPFDGRIVKFLFSDGEILIPDGNSGDEEKILADFLKAIKARGINNI